MDLDQINKLTDDKLSKRVAELCGWHNCAGGRGFTPDSTHPSRNHRPQWAIAYPPYAADLEAMQVAVSTLPDSGSNSEYAGMETYLRVLIHEVRGEWPGLQRDYDGDLRAVERATARQRAIAFVCTKEQKNP